MQGVFTAHQDPGAVLLLYRGHVGAGNPSCTEEGLKVVSFRRTMWSSPASAAYAVLAPRWRSCLLSGHGLAGAVQSHLGVQTWASI